MLVQNRRDVFVVRDLREGLSLAQKRSEGTNYQTE